MIVKSYTHFSYKINNYCTKILNINVLNIKIKNYMYNKYILYLGNNN